MKKILNLLVATIFIMIISSASFAHTVDDPLVTDLIAGQQFDVGDVEVWNDGSKLYVKFLMPHPDWCLMRTHLHVATSITEIPQKNGNPKPGQFDYMFEHECGTTSYTYTIPMTWSPGDKLFIAAHADVCTYSGFSSDADAFIASLPTTATLGVFRTLNPSYFETHITNGDILDGIFNGWCIDTDRSIVDFPTTYCAYVYSSYDEYLPSSMIEYPENLDLINWIVNQDFVGQAYSATEQYTMGDVQVAIWTLTENWIPDPPFLENNVGPYKQYRVDTIVASAQANGEGFIPGCIPPQNRMVVLLFPHDCGTFEFPVAQITFIPFPIPCVQVNCETAWGNGDDFPGRNWATYITYTVQ